MGLPTSTLAQDHRTASLRRIGRKPRLMRIEVIFMLVTAVLLVLVLVGCIRPVPSLINLYDLSGSNLLQCHSVARTPMGDSQGTLKCTATGGEKFQGEWMAIAQKAESDAGIFASSMPAVPRDAVTARWTWATNYGVDMEALSGRYGVFILYGSKGTVVDGIFVFRTGVAGIIGAATDNKGHRYKVMG